MTPSTPQRVAEVPAAQRKAVQVKEEPADVGGATEEQARAILRAAQRALEEEKAAGAGGAKPSPVLRSLQRFLAQRLAVAAATDVQRVGESTSS